MAPRCREYLTGFHKRKVERRKIAVVEIQKKIKEEQSRVREEVSPSRPAVPPPRRPGPQYKHRVPRAVERSGH